MGIEIDELKQETRAIWDKIEDLIFAFRDQLKDPEPININPKSNIDDFVAWGKSYTEKLKNEENFDIENYKKSVISFLTSMGVSETLFADSIKGNKKEVFESLLGESIAVLALVFAWKTEDKEAFSQAIGEIGVASLFALSPLTAIIAIVGLAMGYNKLLHKEAIKKGGVLSLVGLGVHAVVPGGFIISFLAALVAVIFFNKFLKVDRPIEDQINELVNHVKSEDFKRQSRGVWQKFEDVLNRLKATVEAEFRVS